MPLTYVKQVWRNRSSAVRVVLSRHRAGTNDCAENAKITLLLDAIGRPRGRHEVTRGARASLARPTAPRA